MGQAKESPLAIVQKETRVREVQTDPIIVTLVNGEGERVLNEWAEVRQ